MARTLLYLIVGAFFSLVAWSLTPTGSRHAREFAAKPAVMGNAAHAGVTVIILPILFLIAWFNGAF